MSIQKNKEENEPSFSNDFSEQEKMPVNGSQYLLSLLLNNTDESFILINAGFNVILFNQQAQKSVRDYFDLELFNGFHFLDLAQADRKDLISNVLQQAFSGVKQTLEMPVFINNDALVYIANSYKPIYNKEEEIIAVMITSKDNTEAKLAEQSLKESEKRWRFALEGSNHGLWDWNLQTGKMFFSNSFKQLHGFTDGEIENPYVEWNKRLHPDDKNIMENAIQTHLKDNTPYYESIYRMSGKEGLYKWILARGMIVEKDEHGAPSRMIGTHTDITAQKNAQESYKHLFYNHPIPMWTYEQESLKIIEVNDAAILLYGYSRAEFLNLTLKNLRPKEDEQILNNLLDELKEDQMGARHQVRHLKKSGAVFFVEETSSQHTNGDKKLRLVSINDISEKVQAEQQLKTSENHYRLLFKSNPLPSWIYDIDTFQILEVNDAALHFYGYTKDEFSSKSLLEIHPEKYSEKLKHIIKDSSGKEKITLPKWKHTKKNGKEVWVNVQGNKLTYYNKNACLEVIHDISAQVKADEELKKSNERFRLAAKAASEAYWEWDIEKERAFISPVYKEMFGHDIDPDKNYEEWEELIHFEDREITLDCFYKWVADPSKDHWECEYRYLKADGSYMYVQDQCIFLRNKEGKAVKAIGTVQNIQKRKIAEQELKKSNERFHLATKATSDAIYDWDLTTNVITWGEGMASLFDHNPAEINIETWENLIHVNDRKRVVQSLTHTIEKTKKKLWKAQYCFQKKDGTFRYIIEKGFIVREKNGKALRMIGALQDITELKLQEKELLKSNNRYKYASLATADIIWDWDIQKGTILWSDNYSKILGWPLPPDNTLPENLNVSHFHPEDKERLWNLFQNILKHPEPTYFQEDFRYAKKDGTYAYVTDEGYVVRNAQGEAIRIIGAIRDITQARYGANLLELERQIFEMSAVKEIEFFNVVNALLVGIEKLHPGMLTSVLMVQQNQTVQHLAAPTLPDEIKRAINGRKLGPEDGACGAAMFHRQMVIVTDIENDLLFKNLKELAAKHNLKSAWSVPVIDSAGTVMGSFAMYHTSLKTPDENELNSIERAKNLLQILLENHFSIKKIQVANERFDIVMHATHDLIWDWDLDTGSFYRNAEGLKKVYGVHYKESIENIQAWLVRIHPEDQEHVQTVINNILQATEQQVFDLEYRFKRDDGAYNYVYDRGIIMRNDEGKPTRMIGAAQNITDRKQLEQQLIQRELEKQKLIGQATIETQEQERGEIGKELHDNVNQVLTTTKLYLELSLSNPEMKDELIEKSSKNVIYVINEIRQLSRSLMNPSLGDLGVIDSINDLIENINLTRKLHVVLNASEELEEVLNEQQKLTIFRIVQEALNNGIKHAKATSVLLDLSIEKGMLTLNISDDGIGFDPISVKKGSGLKNIQNRVYLSNGTIRLESTPGNGCKIEIKLPINTKNTN